MLIELNLIVNSHQWSFYTKAYYSTKTLVSSVTEKWVFECPAESSVASPQVYEVVPCLSDCSQYVWVAEPWSVWKVSNVDLKENCGEGVQTRKVRYDWTTTA